MIPPPRFQVGGAVRPGCLYVPRGPDEEVPRLLAGGGLCTVLAPRQIGKSSLRVRSSQGLRALGIRTASVDLTALGGTGIDLDTWCYGLCEELARELDLPDPLEFWRRSALGPVQRWLRWCEDVALPGGPLVLFIDEIDRVLALDFPADDLFLALRATRNRPAWSEVGICLLGVAAPQDLVHDPVSSPFNLGHRVRLEDFRSEEARALLPGLAGTADPEGTLATVLGWTDGHPFMTARLCEAVVDHGWTVEAAVEQLFFARGVDTDLAVAGAVRRMLVDDGRTGERLDLYRRVLESGGIAADERDGLVVELLLCGVVAVRESAAGPRLVVRNRVIQRALDVGWVRRHRRRRRLVEQAWAWIAAGRRPDDLLRGAALSDALGTHREGEELAPEEAEFLVASTDLAQLEERARRVRAEAEAGREAELADLRQEAQRLAWQRRYLRVAVGMVIVLVVGAMSVSVALWSAWEANRRLQARALASDAELLARSRGEVVATLAAGIDAVQRAPSDVLPAAVRALSAAVDARRGWAREVGGRVRGLAWEGDHLVVCGVDEAPAWFADLGLVSAPAERCEANRQGEVARADELQVRVERADPDSMAQVITVVAASGQTRTLWVPAEVVDLATSPDGRRLAAAVDDDVVRLWDGLSGRLLHVDRSLRRRPEHVAFSPDGRRLAIASRDEVSVQEVLGGDVLQVWGGGFGVMSQVAVSPQGAIAVVGGDGRVWLIPPGGEPRVVGQRGREGMAFWAADGSRFVATDDQGGSTIFSADGVVLATLSDSAGSPIPLRPGEARQVVVSRQGAVAVVADGSVLWERPVSASWVSWSPDGRSVVVLGVDGLITLLDGDTGEVRGSVPGLAGPPYMVSWSPDGRWLVEGSATWEALLFDMAEVRVRQRWPRLRFSGLGWTPDSRTLVVSMLAGPVGRYAVLDGTELPELVGHTDIVRRNGVSPDGQLVVAGADNGEVRVWRAEDGAIWVVSPAHSGVARYAQFLGDGEILTGGDDGWIARRAVGVDELVRLACGRLRESGGAFPGCEAAGGW